MNHLILTIDTRTSIDGSKFSYLLPVRVLWVFLVSLLFCSFQPAYAEKKQNASSNIISICQDQNQPVLMFSYFFTDNLKTNLRQQELWMDRSKEDLRGIWLKRGEKPIFVVGKEYEGEEFFLCAYRLGQKKVHQVFLGTYSKTGIRLTAVDNLKEKPIDLIFFSGVTESNSFSFKNETRSISHQIKGKIPKNNPNTCEVVMSTFRIIAPVPSISINSINSKIEEIENRIFDAKKEFSKCAATTVHPRLDTVVINRMFASDQYISIKYDISQIQGSSGGLSGGGFNFDLQRNKNLLLKDIFDQSEQDKILIEVQERIKWIFGENSRLRSLESVDFSFNTQTLVISFDPVDESGQYLSVDHVDVPIPLDAIFIGMGVKKRGPFSR